MQAFYKITFMKDVFKIQTAFFLPLGRRIVAVGLILCWFVLELWRGEPVWMFITGAAALYCIYQFLIVFDADAVGAELDKEDTE